MIYLFRFINRPRRADVFQLLKQLTLKKVLLLHPLLADKYSKL